MAQSVSRFAVLATGTVIAGALGLGGAGEALADGRQPAPIVFAGPGGSGQDAANGQRAAAPVAPTAQTAAAPAPVSRDPASQQGRAPAQDPDTRASARIAFVYPSAGGSAAPAPGQPETRTVAALPAPVPAAPAADAGQPAGRQPGVQVPPVAQPGTSPGAAGTDSERLVPVAGPAFDQVGMASWYGEAFHGRPTANGEVFDMNAMTAAHPSLPLPSLIQVVNLANNREVVVRVNDRGPFAEDRILDLSKRAAEVLDFIEAGETRVRIRYLGPAPVGGASAGAAPVAPPVAPAVPGPAVPTPVVPSEAAPAPVPQPMPVAPPARQPVAMPLPGKSAAPVRAVRPAGPREQFFVQLGAFSSISNAERLKSSLSANLPVAVQPARVNGADFFRVLVGPWQDEAKASAVQAELARSDFGPGMVVSQH